MCHAVSLVHVMRGEENRGAFGRVEILHVRPQLIAALRIEAESGFVEKKNFRRVQKAARDFKPALHAAGERLHIVVATLPKLEGLQQTLDALATNLARHVIENAVKLHVFVRGLFGIKARVLKDNPEPLASFILMGPGIEPVEFNGAARRPQERGEHFDCGGLAGAVGAEKGEYLPLGNVKRDTLYGFKFVERLR
jgi:hypothetical protein